MFLARVPKIENPERRAVVLKSRGLVPAEYEPHGDNEDRGPPELPGPDLDRPDYLEGMYLFYVWVLRAAATKRSFGEIRSLGRTLGEIYDELARIRRPGRKSVWELSPEERRAKFAASMPGAPLDMLWAALDELIRRGEIGVDEFRDRMAEIDR
jgi:hypothetical protein